MRVLVVENDPALGQFLQRCIGVNGHEVDWVQSVQSAKEQAAVSRPDLLVLDIDRGDVASGLSGMEVLRDFHERYMEMAILVLTANKEVEHRVAYLNAGADDCLLKPFSFHELTARCSAILRRLEKFSVQQLEFGGVSMNLAERRVRFLGRELELSAKEFQVLETLMRRRGECCSRDELLRAVWPEAPESGTNIVDVYVSYLRRKFSQSLSGVQLRLDGRAEMVIETVRGAGYRVRATGDPRGLKEITRSSPVDSKKVNEYIALLHERLLLKDQRQWTITGLGAT
jgi:DNA-binding response OmpR family regulator